MYCVCRRDLDLIQGQTNINSTCRTTRRPNHVTVALCNTEIWPFEMEEEIDLEKCSYGQLSEVQMLRDLDLDLGSGQGHVNVHSTCSTSCMLNHVTVVSRTTEIWPFEFRQILILDEV